MYHGIMDSLRQQVFKYLQDHPTADTERLQNAFKEVSWNSVRTYRNQYWKEHVSPDITDKKIPKSTTKTPPQETSFIDDPNELLLSVAIRELNKPNPDPRWASILINCKKEKITNTNEVIDQFKNLPTQALVNLLNKSSQEEY